MAKNSTKNADGLGTISYVMRNDKKYWTGRVTIGYDLQGRQIRRSFSSYKQSEVTEKMKAAQNAADSNISGVVNRGDTLVGDFIHYWIFNIKSKEVKSVTLDKYNTAYKLRINPFYFAKTKVKDVTIVNLQRFIDILSNQEGVSRSMAKEVLSIIKLALEHAITLGILNGNPAEYVKLPLEKKMPTIKSKYRIFSEQEQRDIIDALDLTNVVDQMLYLDFFTGLRRGELRGLNWKSFRNDSLFIYSQLQRKYTFEDGKRKMIKNSTESLKTFNSKREVPLPNFIVQFMRKLKVASIEKHLKLGIPFTDESYVFSDSICRPIEEKRPNRRLQAICKRLGIEERPLHSVRHSYATRLFEQGVEVKTVQILMGHSDYQTTMDIYVHVMPETKQKAVSVFDKAFGGI